MIQNTVVLARALERASFHLDLHLILILNSKTTNIQKVCGKNLDLNGVGWLKMTQKSFILVIEIQT
jgi:hypothetical protein